MQYGDGDIGFRDVVISGGESSFYVLGENKRKRKDILMDLARELKKSVKHESDGDTNCN